ncbi:MAG: universal stress protein [Paracoccaceae bacterium]
MPMKSVLAVLTQSTPASQVLTAAAQICAAHDAHLDVLALGVDVTQIGYAFVGSAAVLMEVAQSRAESEARAQEAAARAALHEQAPGLRWGLEAVAVQIGALTDLVAARARFADLVVLARPYGPGRGVEAEAVLEAALFNAQAAVLVLPEGGAVPVLPPRRIVLAWNQSAEALAATRRALPYLKAADLVQITVIDPPSHGPERSDPGGMLCQMLVRHGVKAEVVVLARTLPRVSDVLMRHVRDQNADMLVMGAYGHSRFREAILGGATRNLLEEASVPVFLAH